MARCRLSVIMPNFNDSAYLPDSLGAVLSQSRAPDEVVVVDDGSTDGSVALLQDLARRHPNLRVLRNDRNRGVVFTTNRALAEVAGDYVCMASANDRLRPGHFEASMELLERHPEAGLSFSDYASMDGQAYRFYLAETPGLLEPRALRERCGTLGYFPVTGCSAIFRRRAYDDAGGLRPALLGLSDYVLCLMIAARHGIVYLPRAGMEVRRQQGSYGLRLFKWSEQRKAGGALFRLLESDAGRDAFAWIRESGIWPPLQPYIVTRLLGERRYWPLLRLRTLRQAMWDSAAGLLTRHVSFDVKRRLSGFRDRRRAAAARLKP